ncbi:InlB B-repeat-containing protein [Candidatus Magnetominusculus dajiuhuensis]|uniref:InlB B-repeat-containing protein n=1 Tax=Candidatus Magnetominusculus dajiuhuensis TaxID=3137712 RepID=UPI003B42A179
MKEKIRALLATEKKYYVVSVVVLLIAVFCLSSLASASQIIWTTSQGNDFTVTSDGVVKGLTITASTSGSCYSSYNFAAAFSDISVDGSGNFTATKSWSSSAISDYGSYSLSVKGNFTSSTALTGTWSSSFSMAYGGSCSNSGSGTWTAASTGVYSYILSVTKSGTGSGTVTASSGTLSWSGSTGTTAYRSGTSVTLTAAASDNSTFTSWSGCDSTIGSQCTVTMSADKSVSATFYTYTWTAQTGAGSRNWWSVASSSDGTKLVAVAMYGDYIYTSTDSGATWTKRTGAGSQNWWSVASSSDGTKLAAVTYGDYIYTSTDSGATWGQQTGAGSRAWNSVASSSDGTKLVAPAGGGGYIYTGNYDTAYASEAITAIYNQAASWFGSTSGSVVAATSGGVTYYGQLFTNGATIVAWTDGNLYTYYNGTLYALGVNWRTLGKSVLKMTAIYNQSASWFGSISGNIITGTYGGVTYYGQWFTNGAALVAWPDGNMFTYYNGNWYALGVSWK